MAASRGRLSRRKGANYEREVAKAFQSVWPHARRGIGQARAGGDVPDVQGTPLWIEAKHRKQVSITGAMRQAVEAMQRFVERGGDPDAYHFPLVAARVDDRATKGRMDLVVMRQEDFLELARYLPNGFGQTKKDFLDSDKGPNFNLARPHGHSHEPPER